MNRFKARRPGLSRRNAAASAVFAALSALVLSACMSMLAGGSSSTETGDKVALTGTVTGGNGQGVPGVIVSLAGSSLADTTDITGFYALSGHRSEAEAGNHPDTLRYVLNGQAIVKTEIRALVGAVPVVTIVQRGFSGSFSGPGGDGIGRIEGVVTGNGIAAGDSIAATFFHNTLAGNYSGFLWFPPAGESLRHYVVRVNVYDETGRLTGRSQNVPFNDLAGNIVIPDFDPQNLNTTKAAASRRAAAAVPSIPQE